MLMTTGKLIALRAYNVVLGRWPLFSTLLRRVLIGVLVSGRKDKYVPATRYFDPRELG